MKIPVRKSWNFFIGFIRIVHKSMREVNAEHVFFEMLADYLGEIKLYLSNV